MPEFNGSAAKARLNDTVTDADEDESPSVTLPPPDSDTTVASPSNTVTRDDAASNAPPDTTYPSGSVPTPNLTRSRNSSTASSVIDNDAEPIDAPAAIVIDDGTDP
ncbi:MAG: hypothetical protein OXG57_14425 [Acidimicrobiaceae bacterium]|nr:hypothetical protein [Acidimicrobiaceae bacterium]